MKMLRWVCGVTQLDSIRNDYIRDSIRLRDVADKLQESCLRWYSQVSRGPPDYVGNIIHKYMSMMK